MEISRWFLSSTERANAATRLDSRHADGSSWSSGNDVRALVHGASYFPELLRCVRLMQAGDEIATIGHATGPLTAILPRCGVGA